MNNAQYKHRLTVGVTEKMNDLLEDLAISRTRKDSPISKADLIREALRLYLDEQADARGSRKQIAKSLESKMEDMNTAIRVLFQHLKVQQATIERLSQDLQPVIERVKPRPK